MSQGLCPSCGAAVKLTAGQTDTKCTYCDSVVTLQQAEAQAGEVKNSKFAGTLMIAETAQEGGSYAEAIHYYNKTIEQEPSFADAWLNKGICIVRTSQINNLKIPEAISSWRAAIKIAKNQDSMKKRVAKEINRTVTDFYPIFEKFYLKFYSTDDALEENLYRFLLLESALALALLYHPSAEIAKNGIVLCDRFVDSMKKVQRRVDAEAKVAEARSQGDASDYGRLLAAKAKGVAVDMKSASEIVAYQLKQLKVKYEDCLAQFDGDFRAAQYARLLKHRLEAAEKKGKENSFEMTAVGGLVFMLLVLGLCVSSGHLWVVGLIVTICIVAILWLGAKKAHIAQDSASDFMTSAHANSPDKSFQAEEMIASVERALVKGCSCQKMREALIDVSKQRGLPQHEINRYLQAFDGIQAGKDITTLGLSVGEPKQL